MTTIANTPDTIETDTDLTRPAKFLWGISGLGMEALDHSRAAWLLFFYATPIGTDSSARLSLALVTLLLFAGKLLEAFADSLIGYWSDRTSSRLGRRIPFVLLATPPMALFAVLLFDPPAHISGGMTAVYFLAMVELFFVCSSLAGVPFSALLPEIAQSDENRIALSAWAVYFGVLGAGVGLVGSGLLISRFGYVQMAVVMALLALGCRYLGVVGVWPLVRRDTPVAPGSFSTTMRLTFNNRPFLVFLLSFVLFSTALAMLVGLVPFYVSGVLRQTDTGTWASLLTGVGIGSMMLAIPFFSWIARRSSKYDAYLKAMLGSAVAFPVLFLSGLLPGISRDAQALAALVIVGAPLAGVYLFPGPIIADLCDRDAQLTGMRREGMFFSVLAFMDQLVEAFAPLFLGLILLLGHTPEHLLGVRLVGPAAGLIVLVGYIVLRRYGTLEE